jgi:long-subunit fatty acid transport protein
MKKFLFCAAIAVFGLWNVNAQEVKFGVKAGLNLASISGDDTEDLDGRTSFHFGGIAEIKLSDKFSFQPELLYSAQGAKSSYEDQFEKEEATIKLDYINLPLMAKYYVAEGFSIEAGPQIGFLMNSEADYDYIDKEDPEFSESGTEDLKDEIKGIDFGFNLGFGYKLEGGLNFGARYNLGLSDLWDVDNGGIKNQNSVIQISIGYMF